MALNFFQQLPLQLTQFIFTVEFLERVDRELRACYSRVMNLYIDFGHLKNKMFLAAGSLSRESTTADDGTEQSSVPGLSSGRHTVVP
jgi:hypothetical protein